jgi:hypothetical protein
MTRRTIIKTGILSLAIAIGACTSDKVTTANYYFDPDNGTDTGTGLSPEQAFVSLSRIMDLNLQPGDSVLLKSGAIFTEPLYISCKGDSAKPVVVGKYGGEAKPHIKGDGSQLQAVHVFNSEYLVVRDLEISNKGETPAVNQNGLFVQLKDFGTAHDITIDNLFVHDVFGSMVKEKGSGHAIYLQNNNDDDTLTRSSHFDGLLIQNCHIKDCQRNGIIIWGNWVRRRWDPSLNVVIRNNLIEGVPGDGIVPTACESPLIEYNIMRDCPATLPPTEACDGIWPWSCDNAVVQYNIVSDHKSYVDAYGFDSDWNSTNSLFQYNLSYNNDGGFILICNSGGWTPDWSIGNTGTVVKYNISINDGLRSYIQENHKEHFSPVIHMTGPVSNTLIEKNLIYVCKKPEPEIDKTVLSLTDWSGYPDSTFFNDNFIFVEEPNLMADLTNSTNTFFEGNLFIGDLKTPAKGFAVYPGIFDRAMWYDKEDANWDKLLKFVSDKSVTLNGEKVPVLQIIGADE